MAEIECVAFARQYRDCSHLIHNDAALLVKGTVSVREDEPPKILASDIRPLEENGRFVPRREPKKPAQTEKPSQKEARSQPSTSQATVTKLYLRVPNLDCEQYRKAVNLAEIFEGTVRVIFYDSSKSEYVKSDLGVELSSAVLYELRSLLGEENVVPK